MQNDLNLPDSEMQIGKYHRNNRLNCDEFFLTFLFYEPRNDSINAWKKIKFSCTILPFLLHGN